MILLGLLTIILFIICVPFLTLVLLQPLEHGSNIGMFKNHIRFNIIPILLSVPIMFYIGDSIDFTLKGSLFLGSLAVISFYIGSFLYKEGIIFPSVHAARQEHFKKKITNAILEHLSTTHKKDTVETYFNEMVKTLFLARLSKQHPSIQDNFNRILEVFYHLQKYSTVSEGFTDVFTVKWEVIRDYTRLVVELTDGGHKLFVTNNSNDIEISINADAVMHGMITKTINDLSAFMWSTDLKADTVRTAFNNAIETKYTEITEEIVDEFCNLIDFSKENSRSREQLLEALIPLKTYGSTLSLANYDPFLKYVTSNCEDYSYFRAELAVDGITMCVFTTEPNSSESENVGVPSIIRSELQDCVYTLLRHLPSP